MFLKLPEEVNRILIPIVKVFNGICGAAIAWSVCMICQFIRSSSNSDGGGLVGVYIVLGLVLATIIGTMFLRGKTFMILFLVEILLIATTYAMLTYAVVTLVGDF